MLHECGKLTELPASLAKCPLETLYVNDCNKLATLPEATFENLQSLVLFGGKLKSIPAGYWSPNATFVEVGYRPIRKVPAELRAAKNLRTLKLWHASIKKLPEWVTELTELEELDLRGNKLETLPDLSALTKLRTLMLRDNPWADEEALKETLAELDIADVSFDR